jgi:hypothetical protein
MFDVAKGFQVLWCRECGAELRYEPGSNWAKIIYPLRVVGTD